MEQFQIPRTCLHVGAADSVHLLIIPLQEQPSKIDD